MLPAAAAAAARFPLQLTKQLLRVAHVSLNNCVFPPLQCASDHTERLLRNIFLRQLRYRAGLALGNPLPVQPARRRFHRLSGTRRRDCIRVCAAGGRTQGVVVFFSSFAYLEEVAARWRHSGAWARLQALPPPPPFPQHTPLGRNSYAAIVPGRLHHLCLLLELVAYACLCG